MSKDKKFKTSHMWYTYAAASAALSGAIGYLFNELKQQKVYSYYNNFGWDYNYRLHQSLKNLEDNLQNMDLPEFMNNKQYVQFLHTYPEKMKYALELPISEKNSFITEAMKEQHAYEILLRDSFTDSQEIKYSDYAIGHPASDTLKAKIVGPWDIDVGCHKLMKDLGENIHFDTLLKALALDNLDAKDNQRRILFAPIEEGEVGGFADYLGRVFISTPSHSEEALKGTLIHEFSHRGMYLSNQYSSSEPYPEAFFTNPQKIIFEDVMKQTLTNLHQQFIPNIIPPSDLKELAISLDQVKETLSPQEKVIIDAISSTLFVLETSYTEHDYHSEFVVRMPQIIAVLGELPPHIRDCSAPLEGYYKTQITPRWLDYIETHPRKAMLLSNDMDKYHPETILNRSGEDELMAKDPQKLSKREKLLIVQIQKMQDFIKNGDINAALTYLPELQDERVIRASLRFCIEQESPLFNELFQLIKAPQYLGPQLVLAAKLNRSEITAKLLPYITNQYYLARTCEIALSSNDQNLLREAIQGIKDEWFLSRAKNTAPNNAIITKAITDLIIERDLNYIKDTYPDKLQTGLRILQSPPAQDFIRNKMKNLEYLINFDEAKLTTVLAILEDSQLKDWIIEDDFYTAYKLDYLVTLDKDKLNVASEVLKNPLFKDWIDKNNLYAGDKLGYFVNLDVRQLNTALEILAKPQLMDWIDKDNYYAMAKLRCFVNLDVHQLNTALEILESKAGEEYIGNDITKLQDLLKFSKEQLTSQFNIEFKPQNHISLPAVSVITLEPAKLEQQIISPELTSTNILSIHNLISESDEQAPFAQQNGPSAGNIISQVALAASLAYAAKSIYVVLKKLLVNDREASSESETKDLDKKLLSLHNQFKALYNKREEEYRESPNDLLFKEVTNLKDSQDKAAHTLERLYNFNKLDKSANIEDLQREASIIWKNYKKLKKIKESSNTKKFDAMRDIVEAFKKTGVKQKESVNISSLNTSKTKISRR